MTTLQSSAQVVRLGRREDAENLSALAIQVWLHAYATEGISRAISRYVLTEFSPEKFEALLSKASSAVLVAEVRGNLVGFATVSTETPCPESATETVELATLYVQEHFTSRGVGSTLLKKCEQWALEQAGSAIWLAVNSKNNRAIAFYAKHGFTQVGVTIFTLGAETHENLLLVGGTKVGGR